MRMPVGHDWVGVMSNESVIPDGPCVGKPVGFVLALLWVHCIVWCLMLLLLGAGHVACKRIVSMRMCQRAIGVGGIHGMYA